MIKTLMLMSFINETPRRASSLKLLSVSDKQRGIFIGISSSSLRFVADLPSRSLRLRSSFSVGAWRSKEL